MPDTERLTPPKTVEGSDGLLLEVDGEIVPNYEATFIPFEEGDVVTGKVVRIDQDEVLVDIGYKSEGVISIQELSGTINAYDVSGRCLAKREFAIGIVGCAGE